MSEKTKPEKPACPVCPYCKTEMKPVNFIGYYDEFHCWWCDCRELPNAEKHRGQYA